MAPLPCPELLDAIDDNLHRLRRELDDVSRLIAEAIACDEPRRGPRFLGFETGHCS